MNWCTEHILKCTFKKCINLALQFRIYRKPWYTEIAYRNFDSTIASNTVFNRWHGRPLSCSNFNRYILWLHNFRIPLTWMSKRSVWLKTMPNNLAETTCSTPTSATGHTSSLGLGRLQTTSFLTVLMSNSCWRHCNVLVILAPSTNVSIYLLTGADMRW